MRARLPRTLLGTLNAVIAVACLVGTAIVATPGLSRAASTVNGVRLSTFEARLLADVNAARSHAGRAGLAIEAGTTDVARTWSAHMTAVQAMSHNPHLVDDIASHGSSGWMWIAENVGTYTTSMSTSSTDAADRLFSAYMASSEHKANILDSHGRVIGLGVVERPTADGKVAYYNTMDFTDEYSSAYGATRQPSWGLRPEAASYSSTTTVASFESGYDRRVVSQVSGSGMAVSRVVVDAPTSGDDAARWSVRETTTSASGSGQFLLRDAMNLGGVTKVRVRLSQSNPAGAALGIDVLVTEGWGSPAGISLGHVVLPSGTPTTVTFTVPSSARVFRNGLVVSVSSSSLDSLSSSLDQRRASLAVLGIVFD